MKIRRVDFYPDEWLAGTAELTLVDRGVYITICSLIYSRGERIDEELLHRHCRAHGNALKASLDRLEKARKIVRNGSEIGQKRSENELETVQKRLGKLSESGTKGNEIKRMRAATRVVNGHATTTTTTTTTTNPLSPSAKVAEAEFDEIYKIYPRHVGRGSAFKAFVRVRQTVELAVLIAAVRRYAETRAGEDQRYTPHFSRWLNDERWADQADAPAADAVPPFWDGCPDAALVRTEAQWAARLKSWAEKPNGYWPRDQWGAKPDETDCQAPHALRLWAMQHATRE